MKIWQTTRLVAPRLATVLLAGGGALLQPSSAKGQIIPDNTLGTESSVLVPGDITDLIEGGATRGSALFHSFENFNINTGQQVYFSNPVGIEHILSRVTGFNPSQINGLLGVDGAANFFFINPNGIVFGPDAQLDVEGAFLASTSDRFRFADGTEFRATDPNAAPLVTVNIPLGLQLGPDMPEVLVSEADLVAGSDLTLAAGAVTSTGLLSAHNGEVQVEGVAGDVQVQAVEAQSAVLSASENLVLEESRLLTQGDLSLLAGQTVRIRDSEEQDFRAIAGDDLLIQGHEQVDIYAFSHPQTLIQSGGDLSLVSDGVISADAHFTGGGDFLVLDLEGDIAPLYSIDDPVINMGGDVPLGDYTGASLLVNAGGNITFGTVSITAIDPVIDPGPAFFLNAGGDITGTGNISTTLTDGSLEVSFTADGRIDLSGGTILTTSDTGDAGSVSLISNFSASPTDDPTVELADPAIQLTDVGIDAASFADAGRSGDVTIQANNGAVILDGDRKIFTDTFASDDEVANNRTGGNILIEGTNILITDYTLDSSIREDAQGNGGNITLNALNNQGTIELNGVEVTTRNREPGDPSVAGLPGNITLTADRDISLNDSDINTTSDRDGSGFSTIRIHSSAGSVSIAKTSVNAINAGEGLAGDIFVDAESVDAESNIEITNDSALSADGNFGRIFVGLSSPFDTSFPNSISIANSSITTTNEVTNEGGMITSVDAPSGNIEIGAQSVFIKDNSEIRASSRSTDTLSGAGLVSLQALDGTIILSNSTIENTVINGPGSDVIIEAQVVSIEAGAAVNVSTSGEGDAGSILVNALGNNDLTTTDLTISNSEIQAESSSTGEAGDIVIESTDSIVIQNNSNVSTSTRSEGLGGDIRITIENDGIFELTDNSTLSAGTLGSGNTGQIEIRVPEGTATLTNSRIRAAVEGGATGDSESISIDAGSISLLEGSRISVETFGVGDAGDINVEFTDQFQILGMNSSGRFSGLAASSEREDSGEGGAINVNMMNGTQGRLQIDNGGFISSRTLSNESNGGDILVNVNTLDLSSGGQLATIATARADADNITDADNIADAGNITVNASTAILIDGVNPNFNPDTTSLLETGGTGFLMEEESDSSGADFGDSIDRAQNIDPSLFSTEPNVNVLGSGSIPYVSIEGTGDGTFDFYSFSVSADNTFAVFDIDSGSTDFNDSTSIDSTSIDTELFLLRFDGNQTELIAQNDDSFLAPEDANGSTSPLDSLISLEIAEQGEYIIAVGQFDTFFSDPADSAADVAFNPLMPLSGAVPEAGQSYTLQVAIGDPALLLPSQDINPVQGPNSGLFAEASAGGSSGLITVNAPQVNLNNEGAISASTEAGTGQGVAIDATTVTVNNGSQITAETQTGMAGSIIVDGQANEAADRFILSGNSSVRATAGSIEIDEPIENNGPIESDEPVMEGFTAGDIEINARDFQVLGGSEITVSSRGVAGNLSILTERVTLDNGSLTAIAGQGEGGANISIDLSQGFTLENFVLLRNESLISADAQGDATGGNIEITADFILGEYPTGPRGSDVEADAEQGNGGVITINAPLGVFGLKFRLDPTPLNDITANSQSGGQGTVTINTLEGDPDSGLAELAFDFVDASDQTSDRCVAGSGEGSEITVSGRGGLPTMPTDILGATTADAEDWVTLDSDPNQSMASAVAQASEFTTARQNLDQQSLCHRAYRASQEGL